MWKKTMKKILVLLTFTTLFVAGCGDGRHAKLFGDGGLIDPGIVAPEIVFTIASSGDPETKAEAVTIQSGESVLVEWDVVAVAKPENIAVSLVSDELDVAIDNAAPKDQRVFENVTTDARFILTVKIRDKAYTKEVLATIQQAPKLLNVSLTADPATITEGDPSKLCWTISDNKATYKITDDAGADVSSMVGDGSATLDNCLDVRPIKTTEYKITVTGEGISELTKTTIVTVEPKPVEVTPPAGDTPPQDTPPPVKTTGELTLETSGDKVVFGSEGADVEWKVKDSSGAEVLTAKVVITGGEFGEAGKTVASSGKESVKPKETVTYIITASAEGATAPVSKQVKVAVRAWKGPSNIRNFTDEATARTVISLTSQTETSDIIYAGFNGPMTSDGKIRFDRGNSELFNPLPISFLTLLLEKTQILNDAFLKDLDYPVNAILLDPANQDNIFLATTGAVIKTSYANDKRSSEIYKTYIPWGKDSAYTGSHPSCDGETQKGWANNIINSLQQICDIAFTSTGKMIAAADHVIAVATAEDAKWTYNAGTELYGRVSHDLEVTSAGGAETIYVATDLGLYSSTDDGATFAKVAGAPELGVYSVKVIGNKIYVGAVDGSIYSCTVTGCSKWESKQIAEGAKIYQFAADTTSTGAVFAATSAGVYYGTADGKWKNISLDPVPADASVRSVIGITASDGKTGSIYIGTSAGVFEMKSEILKSTSTATDANGTLLK